MSALFVAPGRLAADPGRHGSTPDVMGDLEAEFFVDWQVELSEPFARPPADPEVGIFPR